eukprot:1524872-Pyramimonas_sp.AAC.1
MGRVSSTSPGRPKTASPSGAPRTTQAIPPWRPRKQPTAQPGPPVTDVPYEVEAPWRPNQSGRGDAGWASSWSHWN